MDNWNKADSKGNINVPDYLDGLVNYVGTQLRFNTISGKSESQIVVDIVFKIEQNLPICESCNQHFLGQPKIKIIGYDGHPSIYCGKCNE